MNRKAIIERIPIRELKEGEHYYAKQAVESVTIGKWVVAHSPGQCIHDTPTKDS